MAFGVWDMMKHGNFYVRDIGNKGLIKWKPNDLYEQQFREIYEGGHRRWVTLKARRMYFSTHCAIAAMCYLALRPYTSSVIVNWKKEAGEKLLKQLLLPTLKNSHLLSRHSNVSNEIRFKHGGAGSNSILYNESSMRSLTTNILHFTDLGAMAKYHPAAAAEALSGGIDSSPDGIVKIESTAAGPAGEFSKICREAMEMQKLGHKPGPKQFKFAFYAWNERDENRLDSKKYDIPYMMEQAKDNNEYWAYHQQSQERRIAEGIPIINDNQIVWHFDTWRSSPASYDWGHMYNEHPGNPEEAFFGNDDAQFLSKSVQRIERWATQEGPVRPDNSPVHVSFDFGTSTKNKKTALIFWQLTPTGNANIIDFHESNGESMEMIYGLLDRQTYNNNYGMFILPHDAAHKHSGNAVKLTREPGMSIEDDFHAAGRHNTVCMERPNLKQQGIDASITFIVRCRFYKENKNVQRLRDKLVGARLMMNQYNQLQNSLVPDENADAYDAFEQGARYFLTTHERKEKNKKAWSGYYDRFR